MADPRNKPSTHYSSLESEIVKQTTAPSEPVEGDFYYDTSANKLKIYANSRWNSAAFTTTTSTSTSTTTTSTSTTTTSTSTSITTSTSTSITTSTTTTL